jgi:lysozyme
MAGKHFLANEEGKKPWVYDDGDSKPIVTGKVVKGRPTFGIGHLVKPGEKFPMFPKEATDEFIYALLDKDIAWAVAIVNNRVKVPLTQNQFDALVCFVFNVGDGRLPRERRGTAGFVPGFQNSTLLFELNQGKYQLAADHFLDWKYDDHKKPVLLPRRQRERALFLREAVLLPLAPSAQKTPAKKAPSAPAKKASATSGGKSSKAQQAGSRKPQGK